jgi:hypothetical protein
MFALVMSSHFDNYGYLDYTKNLSEMIEKVNNLKTSKSVKKVLDQENTIEQVE